jgi:uncharacterized protein
MLSILLHSSKTMRQPPEVTLETQQAALISKATQLAHYLKTLTVDEISSAMHVSPKKAEAVFTTIQQWTPDTTQQMPAIDAFIGDIYSGLQVQTFDRDDRRYANKHLFILSGLYGVLRALDGVSPYRLEMGYRLPAPAFKNLYQYWGADIAQCIPSGIVINASAVEYTKAVLPYLKDSVIITPKFLTNNPSTGEPKFVVVHAKIARGAFAYWIIKNRIKDVNRLKDFNELGYVFNSTLSTADQPVFTCNEFGGLGLSVRLT